MACVALRLAKETEIKTIDDEQKWLRLVRFVVNPKTEWTILCGNNPSPAAAPQV